MKIRKSPQKKSQKSLESLGLNITDCHLDEKIDNQRSNKKINILTTTKIEKNFRNTKKG